MKLAILFLAALPLVALDNSVIHRDNSGGISNGLFFEGRWFARGEIPNYCKPFATPSDTSIRAAISDWQCSVLVRWRDVQSTRAITSARIGSPTWTTAGGTLTNIVVASNVATMTTSTAHGLSIGSRIVINRTAGDADLERDNFVVHEVVSATVVKFLTRNVAAATYSTGLTAIAALDPMDPPTACRFTSANHDFEKGETVTIAGAVAGGLTGCDGTFTVTGVSQNEFTVNKTGSGTYTPGSATATGPSVGSVRHALAAYRTSVPNGGSTRVDWVNSTDASSAGNEAATIAAGFDKTEMLAATWDATLTTTANVAAGSTAAIATDARTMLTAWSGTESACGPRYWVRGPVLTELILSYRCFGATTYDFGYKPVSGSTITQNIVSGQTNFGVADVSTLSIGQRLWFLTSNPSAEIMTITDIGTDTGDCVGTTALCITVTRATGMVNSAPSTTTYTSGKAFGVLQWQDASSSYKVASPSYVLTFAGSWSGVGIHAQVDSTYYGLQAGLWYSAALATTSGTRLTASEFKHTQRTSWGWNTWDGDDPEFYCKGSAATDPENCAVVLQQGSDASLSSIKVTSNVGTVNCAAACGVSVGNIVTVDVDRTVPNATVDRDLPRTYTVATVSTTVAGNCTTGFCYTFATVNVANGTYIDNSLKVTKGIRTRKFYTDHNTAYLIYAKALPQYNLESSLSLSTWVPGFEGLGARKGRVGMPHETLTVPGLYMDCANYGMQNGATEVGCTRNISQGQENSLFEAPQTIWLQNWDLYGYEFTFCDSCPGGGGNIAAVMHLPLSTVESDTAVSRPLMAGFSTSGFGKFLSLYPRPTMTTADASYTISLVTSTDAPFSSCSASAPVLNASDQTAWPCAIHNNDGWTLDVNHQNNPLQLAYLITAQPYLLDTINLLAIWEMGQNHSFRDGHSWAQLNGTDLIFIRYETGTTRDARWSYEFAPNVAMFGSTSPPVDKHYWNDQLHNIAYAKEGRMQISDGRFFSDYPNTATTNCGGGYALTSPDIWRYVRCYVTSGTSGIDTGGGLSNPLGWPHIYGFNACDAAHQYINCANAPFMTSNWMLNYASHEWGMDVDMGLSQFLPIHTKLGGLMIGLQQSANTNGYLMGTYRSPGRSTSVAPRQLIQTMTEYFDDYNTTWFYNGVSGTTVARTDQTFDLTSDTFLNVVNSYAQQQLSGGSWYTGMTSTLDGCSPSCTGAAAYAWLKANVPFQSIAAAYAKYTVVPRQNVADLSITPGSNTAAVGYTAPTADNCYYRNATTAPTDTLDATDTSDAQTTIGARTINLSGLSPGTTYYFRLTCGTRLSPFGASAATGTGRSSTTFLTSGFLPAVTIGGATTVKGSVIVH